LVPRDESFFDLLEKAAENLYKASKLLVEALQKPEDLRENARRMKTIEQDGDRIVHEVMSKLHRTFITPLDREDIHQLISSVDDVLDYIEAATDRFSLYRVVAITEEAIDLAGIVAGQSAEIHRAMPLLRHVTRDGILRHCVEINRLENLADGKLHDGLERLFADPADPVHILKWRELYELLEVATDKAEDVADIFEGIVLKNA
jgi:predicted phosphate transport protein (TIGR00153 family)